MILFVVLHCNATIAFDASSSGFKGIDCVAAVLIHKAPCFMTWNCNETSVYSVLIKDPALSPEYRLSYIKNSQRLMLRLELSN
jgi:hypothetical protein